MTVVLGEDVWAPEFDAVPVSTVVLGGEYTNAVPVLDTAAGLVDVVAAGTTAVAGEPDARLAVMEGDSVGNGLHVAVVNEQLRIRSLTSLSWPSSASKWATQASQSGIMLSAFCRVHIQLM